MIKLNNIFTLINWHGIVKIILKKDELKKV